jgi:GNAT superfamily N-acetyltransferase
VAARGAGGRDARPVPRTVRRLSSGDLEAVLGLLADDGGYAVRVSGRPAGRSEASGLLESRPPGICVDGKVVLGLIDGDDLVGAADVIRGWPTSEHAHVGLLLTAARRRRTGLGRRLHDAVEELVGTWDDVTTLRLGVVDSNREQADPFWRALGYRPTGEVKAYESGQVRSQTRIWSRPAGC